MLEICLLAGPAFAVGARRSRRQLGLVGANGGDRRHIRAIVLAGGLVIGVAAAVVGTVLGLVLTFALRPLLEDYMGQRFGGFDVRPLELLGIALLAVLTGLLAAIVPAVTASRQTVLASLTGRRGVRRSNRVLPVIGLIAVAARRGDRPVRLGRSPTSSSSSRAAAPSPSWASSPSPPPWSACSAGPAAGCRSRRGSRCGTPCATGAVRHPPWPPSWPPSPAPSPSRRTQRSHDAQSRPSTGPSLPHGAVSALVDRGRRPGRPRGARRRAEDRCPSTSAPTWTGSRSASPAARRTATSEGCGRFEVVIPTANECPLWVSDPPTARTRRRSSPRTERRKLAKDWRCQRAYGGGIYVEDGLLVADAKLLKVLGIDDPGAAKALADGQDRLASTSRNVDRNGKVAIRLITDPKAADAAAEQGKAVPGEVKAFPPTRWPARRRLRRAS